SPATAAGSGGNGGCYGTRARPSMTSLDRSSSGSDSRSVRPLLCGNADAGVRPGRLWSVGRSMIVAVMGVYALPLGIAAELVVSRNLLLIEQLAHGQVCTEVSTTE